MLDTADHPNVYACWNCNAPTDLDESGSIDAHLAMLVDRIDIVHTHDLFDAYPYERLFALLGEAGFDGFCLAELPGSADPERVLRYYLKLFERMTASAR
jgi:hypothetical protein